MLTLHRILKRCVLLYGTGQITALDSIMAKAPSEINNAIQSIPSDMGSGKCVVSYGQDAVFKVSLSHLDDVNGD